MNLNKPELNIYLCSFDAAKFAVLKWHYSKSMPAGELFKVGVCENNCFVGCVLFGHGATPNLGDPYGMDQFEVCELTRIALRNHSTSVSRILSISLKMLKKKCPGLKLVVSFADTTQGHHGGVYQANGWIYAGMSEPATFFLIKDRLTHPRSIGSRGGVQSIKWVTENLDKNAKAVKVPGKHRYLWPFDNETKERIIILSQPYPKRPKQAIVSDHENSGGAAPTGTLQDA